MQSVDSLKVSLYKYVFHPNCAEIHWLQFSQIQHEKCCLNSIIQALLDVLTFNVLQKSVIPNQKRLCILAIHQPIPYVHKKYD